tara:strand:+ start:113 stop:286 length:174 start_codon:yes stop_codon:yes gene_type:complete
MGHAGDGKHYKYKLRWADLSRSQRKDFYQENESRQRRGLPAITKESICLTRWTNGGY